MNKAQAIMRMYQKIRYIHENKQFKKTIDGRQITLDEAIARAKKAGK